MRTTILLSAALAATASAAAAEPRTITRTIERPNALIERMATFDRAARTVAATTTATRTSDGAVATRTYQRSPIESGFAASGSFTGFGGATTSFSNQTVRTETGATTTGSYTNRAGDTFGTLSTVTRIDGGFERSSSVTNAAGETVFSRSVTQTGRAPAKRPRGF